MRHERPDARRRPAVREPAGGPAEDGSAEDGSADDEPPEGGATRRRNRDGSDDLNRVRRRIRDRAERIERREVAEAIAALEARGGLTDEQRETVRLLGAAIARRLTAPPESAVERSDREEPETVRAVARLFDVERE